MDWNNIAGLDELERGRNERRGRIGRLAFDCFHAKVIVDRVRCAMGHEFNRGHTTLGIEYILRGSTPTICKHCLDFEGEAGKGQLISPQKLSEIAKEEFLKDLNKAPKARVRRLCQ